MPNAWGVGIIGAGPGVASLHVPTLARVPQFRVMHICDAGSGRAAEIAAAVRGARASDSVAEMLADRAVEVVAICSPPDLHAEQVIAAAEAGKRAVFCEKPLATTVEDAERVVAACRQNGVALIVGTNHHYDPAWGRARHHITARGDRIEAISIAVSLPPNSRYHEAVSEPPPVTASTARKPPDWDNPIVAAAVVRQLILGLGIHDLPAVRDLAPRIDRVASARPLRPIGFALGFVASDVVIQLVAVMQAEGADALWRMSIVTHDDVVEVDFPPSFLHEGSAVVRVHGPQGREVTYPVVADDGYIAEWQALADALDAGVPIEYDEALEDATYAIALADAAAALIRGDASQ